jgi:hypothetical protein
MDGYISKPVQLEELKSALSCMKSLSVGEDKAK